MQFLRRARLIFTLAVGIFVDAGAESPTQSMAPVPAPPPQRVAQADSLLSGIRPVASIATTSRIVQRDAEFQRALLNQAKLETSGPFQGTIRIAHPPKGIDFKIRIAQVPENIDPGFLAPVR